MDWKLVDQIQIHSTEILVDLGAMASRDFKIGNAMCHTISDNSL